MRIYDIIDKKRNGFELTDAELEFFVSGYVEGTVKDYQASALLMAICINGMTDAEIMRMTLLMAESGDMLDLSCFGDLSVDKHSTGGVGDKTTLIISPIVAELGLTVAKLSGRGLGHTGGTIDKLESIPNFRIELPFDEFINISKNCGVCVCSAGKELVPADKKLYALRDVTATVSSIPLIVSSIMSKKLAGGAKSIVLDVKTGSGAFMKTNEESEELARRMVSIAKRAGRNVSAVITNMDRPLGRAIGNSLEVMEAVSLLRGEESDNDLKEVCITLASELVSLGKGITYEESRKLVLKVLNDKSAYNRFLKWIEMQSGDISVFNEGSDFGKADFVSEVIAKESGYISSVNASGLGICAMHLGAGRASKEDIIDYSAGAILLKKVGDYVEKGEVIARLQSSTVSDHKKIAEQWLDNITFSKTKPESQPIIYKIIR
ncbi:MAG: thymidine phosphorylase [Clostridia bacterium]|nr:thymidine phosphorylase [Clostridia bacterium]